jgi:hypothetical protein
MRKENTSTFVDEDAIVLPRERFDYAYLGLNAKTHKRVTFSVCLAWEKRGQSFHSPPNSSDA